MPVIQQERGVKSIKGLPVRWGVRAYAELASIAPKLGEKSSQEYLDFCKLLDDVTDAPMSIDSTDAQVCMLAQTYANDCASNAATIHDKAELRARMAYICKVRGIRAPDCDDDSQAIARCTDPAWWRGRLRKVHGRAFEAAAIRLGMVSSQKAKYCSDESVLRRISQNRRNAAVLDSVEMTNMDTEQKFKLSALAAKGTGNKAVRRGEMMMRMAGCDKVAKSLNHRGLFVTLTAPSSYHAVLQKSGAANPKFNGATPIDTHRYLNKLWQLTRAKNDRDGIAPYGFRVAEPHHDGCTHWHMLFFMPPKHIEIFVRNLSRYALAEDGNEKGARKTRVTYKALDPAKGQAAGYMAKYVSKNIGENEVEYDVLDSPVITSAMRVDAWAGTWGIRQFQPIGQPPVTVWREFRRVDAETVAGNDVPAHIVLAHAACQRVESKTEKDEAGNPLVIHAADWAEYVEAQGGVKVDKVKTKKRDLSGAVLVPYKSKKRAGQFRFVGIKTKTIVTPILSQGKHGGYQIGLCAPRVMKEGRYGLALMAQPVGVFCRAEADVVYKSTRYTWKKSGAGVDVGFKGLAGGAGFDVPWSPVNNCTGPDWFFNQDCQFSKVARARQGELVAAFDDEWFKTDEYQKIFVPPGVIEAELIEAVRASYANEETHGR